MLRDQGWFNDRSHSSDRVQPILLRAGEKEEAEHRNVPGTSVFYTLASGAEITPRVTAASGQGLAGLRSARSTPRTPASQH